jgi:integrase/recombinase XerD
MLPIVYLNRQEIGLKVFYYVSFNFNRIIYQVFKSLETSFWDQYEKCWVFDEAHYSLQALYAQFEGKAEFVFLEKTLESVAHKKGQLRPCHFLEPLDSDKALELQLFIRYLTSKRYSPNTIKVYSDSLSTFLRYFSTKSILEISNDDLIDFNNNYILKNNFSGSFQNQVVNAVKLFYTTIHRHKIEVELIHRPRREKLLPNVLSKEEVKAILNSLSNEKHKIMLSVIYACGLRRSELLNMKPSDILSDRKLIMIRQSKGKKDRIVPLSNILLEQLRKYYKIYRPTVYLFEGQNKGEKYSARSLELVFK